MTSIILIKLVTQIKFSKKNFRKMVIIDKFFKFVLQPSQKMRMMDQMFFLVVLKDPNGSLRFHFKSLRFSTWQVKSIGFSGYNWLPWPPESKNITYCTIPLLSSLSLLKMTILNIILRHFEGLCGQF